MASPLLALLFWVTAAQGENQNPPWFLSFSSNAKQFTCSGALIRGNWIVTAANCGARSGDAINLPSGANTIEKVILHPQYVPESFANNIALLKLSSQLDVVPVQISTTASSLIGWRADRLHSTSGQILEMSACTKFYGASDESHLCVNDTLCSDTTGSVLFGLDGIAGIRSTSDCSTTPSLYTNLAFYSKWIAQNTADSCFALDSCDSCVASKQSCYWCPSSNRCLNEIEWLADEVCPYFVFSRDECSTRRRLASDENGTIMVPFVPDENSTESGESSESSETTTSTVVVLGDNSTTTTTEQNTTESSGESMTSSTTRSVTMAGGTASEENTTTSSGESSGETPPSTVVTNTTTVSTVILDTNATSAGSEESVESTTPTNMSSVVSESSTESSGESSVSTPVVTNQTNTTTVTTITTGSGETSQEGSQESTDRSMVIVATFEPTVSPSAQPTQAVTMQPTTQPPTEAAVTMSSVESAESQESSEQSIEGNEPTPATRSLPLTPPPTSTQPTQPPSAPPSALPTAPPSAPPTVAVVTPGSEETSEEQSASSEEGINSNIPATNRGSTDICSKYDSCSTCAGAPYMDAQNKRASCVWCGSSNSCITAAAWDAKTVCNSVSFGAKSCPDYTEADRCAAATGCSQCVAASYFKQDRSYQQCVWCGSSCAAQGKTDNSKCPNPTKTCKADIASVKTCRDLKWTVAPGSKSCSSGKVGGQCGTAQTFAQAQAWCAAAGARLCSSSELSNVNVVNSGCNLERERVWTGTACNGGHTSQAGAKFYENSQPARCDSDSGSFKVVCCADDPTAAKIPAPMATKTCKQLGWKVTPGSPNVCSQSTFAGVCLRSVDFRTAQGQCFSVGARLCTSAELANNEAKGSGCKLDSENSWTSTPCAGGVLVSKGSFSTATAKCTDLAQTAAVRCCADGTDVDQVSCEDLGWPVKNGVCSTAKISGQCPGPMDFVDAFNACFEIGTRICTAEQLQSGVGLQSPQCNVGGSRVWSMTKCPGGYMTLSGDGSQLNPPQCSAATSNFPVRCCATSKAPANGARRG